MPIPFDLLCFSHLPWDFVTQRPQHLLTRAARERRVFYVEEPLFDSRAPYMETRMRDDKLYVLTPHLPEGADVWGEGADRLQRVLIEGLRAERGIDDYVSWYYTPMAVPFTRHLTPLATVYDCMDELSLFAKAPPAIREHERELLARADLVFTGGQSLYEAKRGQHDRVYPFPSSVDMAHFCQARVQREEPADQQGIPRPRLGFYGVLDERLNLDLLAAVADARPDWSLVIVGPPALPKFDPALLPRRANIHYLGPKPYAELPAYLAGWDAALLPFARNDATRFISPTKTPEYLAAGKPVVSTSIRDVVHPYGHNGLVRIADAPSDFIAAIEAALGGDDVARLRKVDAFLSQTSWDRTWERMDALIQGVVTRDATKSVAMRDATSGTGKEPVGASAFAHNLAATLAPATASVQGEGLE